MYCYVSAAAVETDTQTLKLSSSSLNNFALDDALTAKRQSSFLSIFFGAKVQITQAFFSLLSIYFINHTLGTS